MNSPQGVILTNLSLSSNRNLAFSSDFGCSGVFHQDFLSDIELPVSGISSYPSWIFPSALPAVAVPAD